MQDFDIKTLPKKKKRIGAINASYSFPCTVDIKNQLKELKKISNLDVNEAFRLFSEYLINTQINATPKKDAI